MKSIILSILLFLVYNQLHSQQLEKYSIYRNDSSYLRLNQDNIAEFRILKKLHQDTMEYVEYSILKKKHQDTIQYFEKLQKYRHYEGKGNFYIKDSVIYINTTKIKNKDYPRFEDIGQSEFNGKLSIEVFDLNNNRYSTFYVRVETKKNWIRFVETDGNTCYIDLSKIRKPVSILIFPINDSVRKCFFPFEIPVQSIKTNKIKVYLTDLYVIKDKLIKFRLNKDENGIFIIAPDDYRRIILR